MIRFRVAKTVFQITTPEDIKTHCDSVYDQFSCTDRPDITIDVKYNFPPPVEPDSQKLVFDSDSIWKLYHIDGNNIFTITTPILGPAPYRMAIFNETYTKGDIYIKLPDTYLRSGLPLPDPIEFPLSELIMISYLARKRGVMFHACGIADGSNGGYLFTGNSTHGKSTTAELWQKQARILTMTVSLS